MKRRYRYEISDGGIDKRRYGKGGNQEQFQHEMWYVPSFHRTLEFMIAKFSVLLIGPTPPPFHGVAVAVQTLVQSRLVEQFHVSHLDLADRRGIQHVNNPDFHDVVLFLRQWMRLVGMLFVHAQP